MKTLIITLDKGDINATICEHENNDESAKIDIIERCKKSNVYMKIDINCFSYVQYKNFASVRDTGESIQGTSKGTKK